MQIEGEGEGTVVVGIAQSYLQPRHYNSCCLFAGVPGAVPASAPASEPNTVLSAVSGADPAEHKL